MFHCSNVRGNKFSDLTWKHIFQGLYEAAHFGFDNRLKNYAPIALEKSGLNRENQNWNAFGNRSPTKIITGFFSFSGTVHSHTYRGMLLVVGALKKFIHLPQFCRILNGLRVAQSSPGRIITHEWDQRKKIWTEILNVKKLWA